MLIYTPYATNTARSLFKMSVGFILSPLFTLPSITLVLDFLLSHADLGKTVLTDLTNSCLLLKAILLAIQISLPKTLLSWCNYFPEICRQSGTGKKNPPGLSFHGHSFLSVFSNKLS